MPVAKKIDLVDRPTNRKTHSGNVPLIGGISIFIGFSVSLLGEYTNDYFLISLIISSFFILFLGFIDDYYPLSVKTRLFAQIFIISIAVWFTDLKFDTFGHSFGFSNQISLGLFSYPITILGIVFVTNAFNLIDGADGVAIGLAITALLGINIIDINRGILEINTVYLGLFGAFIPFLYFQFSKNKE